MNRISRSIDRSAIPEQIPMAALPPVDNPVGTASEGAATSGAVFGELVPSGTEDVGVALVVDREAVLGRESPRTVVLLPSGNGSARALGPVGEHGGSVSELEFASSRQRSGFGSVGGPGSKIA